MRYCAQTQFHIKSISCAFKIHPKPLTTPQLVVYKVCQAYKINSDQLKSESKERQLSDARHMVSYIVSKTFPTMIDSAVALLVNRDRTTVINSVKVAQNLLDTNNEFSSKYKRIQRAIRKAAKQAI